MSSDDMKKLKLAVLNQSVQDYIKLQHPKYRAKKYLEESFIYCVNMFFNEDYRFMYFLDDFGNSLNTKDFIQSASSAYIKNLKPMKKYLKEESIKYWNDKYMKTFTIPPYIVFEGIVYNLLMSETETRIDWSKNEIFFNKKEKNAEETFISLFVEIMKKEHKLKITKKQSAMISKSILNFLKMNKLYLD